jgi:hypothetical protein
VQHLVRIVIIACMLIAGLACDQLRPKPRLATRLLGAPDGVSLDPPPPPHVYWLRVRSGKLPKLTVDNRPWDEVGADPDPFVVVSVNGKEILRTPAATDTIEPQWIEPSGNFEIPDDAVVEVEVRDSDAVGDNLLIGRAKVGAPTNADLQSGRMAVDIGRRAVIYIEVEPAHPMIGLGFDYWVQNGELVIKEVWKHSPAGRAGMEPHDRIVQVAGRDVRKMSDRSAHSTINAITSKPIEVVIQKESGNTQTISLGVGPIYPLYSEHGEID